MRRSIAFLSMKKSFVGLGLLTSVVFAVGCGAGPGINGVPPGGGGTGNYSNLSLKGSYVYQISGINAATGATYQEAGVFTADGNGRITSGIDDVTQGFISSVGNSTTGIYSIANDGTGSISLTGTGFTTTPLALTMVSPAKAYLIAAGALNGAGAAELQSPAAIGVPPTGTFVFKTHTNAGLIATATVGQFTVSAGNFQSGSVDVNRVGAFTSPMLTNFTFNSPISNGRGTGNFTESTGGSGVTSGFYYYIVDSNNIRLLSSDTGINTGGIGRAEMQSAGPFSVSSLAGSYAFGSTGDDNFGLDSVNTVGVFAASAGNITSGAFDSVEDGTPLSNVAITGGTYLVAPNGRVAATFTSSVATMNQVLWMVSPSRAFSITASDASDSSLTQDGTANLQQTTAFSNSSINGQFALVMQGFIPAVVTVVIDRVATLQWDGNGNLKLNELVNDSGVINTPGFLTGTYSAAANGRVTGTISSLSNNLVFYMISDTSGYVLQEDPNTEVSGTMEQQH